MRTVIIPRPVPSLNKTQYAHWRAYTKERDTWMALLRAQLMPRQRAPDFPVQMVLTSWRGVLLDFGNYVGGAKPIPDCLTRLGYLKDDKPAWFHCEYRQFVAPKPFRHTHIVFTTEPKEQIRI